MSDEHNHFDVLDPNWISVFLLGSSLNSIFHKFRGSAAYGLTASRPTKLLKTITSAKNYYAF